MEAADTEGILRIIQSIPSKKAEPFKLWLTQVGAERIEETEDPELAFDRAMGLLIMKNRKLKMGKEMKNSSTDLLKNSQLLKGKSE